MALTVTKIGTNEDGSARYLHATDGHALWTGPVKGPVTLADGTEYEVSADYIEVACDGHDENGKPTGRCDADEVAHLIAMKHVEDGHPTDETFTYEPPAKFAPKKGK